jgi:hypothetical protein
VSRELTPGSTPIRRPALRGTWDCPRRTPCRYWILTAPSEGGRILCPNARRLKELEKTPVRASLHPRKPENSSAKRCITCVRGNTARVRLSKPLRSVCRRPVALVRLGAPKGPTLVRKKAERDIEAGKDPRHKASRKRSRAILVALKRESKRSASPQAVSRQAKKSSAKRGQQARSAAARKAARTRKAA